MSKILGRIFWIFVILVMCLWTYEFYRVRNNLDPKFSFREEEHIYEDGITKEYLGFGYKVYVYNRTDLEGREFVFIFAKEKTNEGVERLDNKVEVIEEVEDTISETKKEEEVTE